MKLSVLYRVDLGPEDFADAALLRLADPEGTLGGATLAAAIARLAAAEVGFDPQAEQRVSVIELGDHAYAVKLHQAG